MCIWQKLKNQLIIQFSLFLPLYMGSTALFGTIQGSHCTISANFYLYLQYFQQKNFSFSKISRSQTDLRVCFMGFASWNFVNFVNLFYFIYIYIYILQICVLVCLDRKKNRRPNPLQ